MIDSHRDDLAELADILQTQSRHMARVMPCVEDAGMRRQCWVAVTAAKHLANEIGKLLERDELPLIRTQRVEQESFKTTNELFRLCDELLPLFKRRAAMQEQEAFLKRCWEATN